MLAAVTCATMLMAVSPVAVVLVLSWRMMERPAKVCIFHRVMTSWADC